MVPGLTSLDGTFTFENADLGVFKGISGILSARGTYHGQLALSTLTFNVPGAIVELSGQYSLRREALAFNGSLFMDARVSQTTTGWKSLMLKVADSLFRKDGRTVIPIKISGTRNELSFGMDVRRVFRRGGSEP